MNDVKYIVLGDDLCWGDVALCIVYLCSGYDVVAIPRREFHPLVKYLSKYYDKFAYVLLKVIFSSILRDNITVLIARPLDCIHPKKTSLRYREMLSNFTEEELKELCRYFEGERIKFLEVQDAQGTIRG